MNPLPIFKILGDAFSGIFEIFKLSYAGLKAAGKILTKYEKDIKAAGEGMEYDPNSKKKHFLSSSRLLRRFSEKNQSRIKKVLDFIWSPSFIQLLGVISIGLMFLSPFGPIAAGIAASISLSIMTGSFLYQTYKLRKNLIRKSNLHLLNDIKNTKLEIEKKLESGEVSAEMMNFYNQNVDPTNKDFTEAQSDKYSNIRNIASATSVNFLTSCTILITAVLSFNIPSAVICGISLIGSTVSKTGRTNAELTATFQLKQSVHRASNDLKVTAQTKTASVQNLHDKSLKQHAFKLTCEKFGTDQSYNKAKFNQVYDDILTNLHTTAPAPKITFWSAARNNIISGFSMHKGLKQHSPIISKQNNNIEAIKGAVVNVRGKIHDEKAPTSKRNFDAPQKERDKSTESFTSRITSRRDSATQKTKTRS